VGASVLLLQKRFYKRFCDAFKSSFHARFFMSGATLDLNALYQCASSFLGFGLLRQKKALIGS
jgi:hypothetical protein